MIPHILLLPRRSVLSKTVLCLRAWDSSNYPGQHGDDYAVFLPLCHANYTSWGARIVNFQPINTLVAPLDSELLSGFFRNDALSINCTLFLSLWMGIKIIRPSKCTIRMLMLTSPFQIANIDTGGVTPQQLYHCYIKVSQCKMQSNHREVIKLECQAWTIWGKLAFSYN